MSASPAAPKPFKAVLNRIEAIHYVGLSPRTWDRLEAMGDIPVKTRLSPGRIGFRIIDLDNWLIQRRMPASHEVP